MNHSCSSTSLISRVEVYFQMMLCNEKESVWLLRYTVAKGNVELSRISFSSTSCSFAFFVCFFFGLNISLCSPRLQQQKLRLLFNNENIFPSIVDVSLIDHHFSIFASNFIFIINK